MSDHAARRRSSRRSGRLRALLGLGVALGLGAVGTFAYWTDDVAINGTTFTSGTLDLQVNAQDSIPAYTSLNLANMVPGNSVAAVLVVKNNGTAPLKYTATSVAVNSPVGRDLAGALTVKITGDAAITGTGVSKTCPGTALTGTGTSLNGGLITTPRPLLTQNSTENICVQVTLNASAPSTLQNTTTTATFTFTGTSDIS